LSHIYDIAKIYNNFCQAGESFEKKNGSLLARRLPFKNGFDSAEWTILNGHHFDYGSVSSSGTLPTIIERMRAARFPLRRPSPGRRPRRLSARRPPSRSNRLYVLIARRLAPNMRAASVCDIPPRTACTTCRRNRCNAYDSNVLVSLRLRMPEGSHAPPYLVN
jgi:hypothetical protein